MAMVRELLSTDHVDMSTDANATMNVFCAVVAEM
jgi:hypothetical protein